MNHSDLLMEKETIHKGWKVVVKIRNGLYESCIIYGIYYPMGRWVDPRPNCGPLAVFDALANAKKFLNGNFPSDYTSREVCIVPCNWVEWTKGLKTVSEFDYLFWIDIEEEEEDFKGTGVKLGKEPPGTRIAAHVMLTGSHSYSC